MTISQHVDRGRRARGADRARRDDVRLPRGPARRAGAASTQAVERWSRYARDDDAVFDREIVGRRAALAPQVSWGTNPGQTAPITGARARAGRRRRASARSTTWRCEAGTPLAGIADRPRLHRLVHQRPPERPARRRRGRARASASRRACRRWWCRARCRSRRRPRPRASTASSPTRASSGATPAAPCASA